MALVIFEGYTIAAAATVLGLTQAAAKTRMHRARLRMRATVQGQADVVAAQFPKGERS
ncbi:sigma factor-like helix-turn-helix DNA-binding protein [Specibacter cremeus]|uniref:sigma factor-like helix-turn-helix DNA-binding protein n=1 Tax=Specibacter cremeus TaxID=1629051 RepID=UPI001F0BD4EF|nr:sigma factor-like helix-turn-helix DNA-binding protein [Specibacter cremeus]